MQSAGGFSQLVEANRLQPVIVASSAEAGYLCTVQTGSDSSGGGALSSGAIAGIVIGALIGAALIVALAFFIYLCDLNRCTKAFLQSVSASVTNTKTRPLKSQHNTGDT